MHEHGIADHLMDHALELAKDQGVAKIDRIVIGVGALSGLDPEALKEALTHVAGHFGLKDVTFLFEKVLPEATCKSCGKNIGQEYICPFCAGKSIEVVSGLDAVILAVTGDDK